MILGLIDSVLHKFRVVRLIHLLLIR